MTVSMTGERTACSSITLVLLRVTTGLLPAMVGKGKGHVVNISSIGVLTNAPRFSAYVASKAALMLEFAESG